MGYNEGNYERCMLKRECDTKLYDITLHDVISQYQNSPNLIGYIESFVNRIREQIETVEDLAMIFNLDCIKGKDLDLIGRILGQHRIKYPSNIVGWFQFEDNQPKIIRNGFDHGKFWDGKTNMTGEEIEVDDNLYRLFLKARARKNNTSSTVNDMYDSLYLVTCRDDLQINAGNGMYMGGFTFYDEPNPKTYGWSVGAWTGPKTPGYSIAVMEFEILESKLRPLDPTTKLFMLNYGLLPVPVGVKLTDIKFFENKRSYRWQ